ncbi:MAG: DUF2029 domain-containing protein [Proteobacteria bacterium]|nr:MAG: DUF2029 domain-containing protein [Pseudomonadota bacterium]
MGHAKPFPRYQSVCGAILLLITLILGYRFGIAWFLNPDARIPQDWHVYWAAAERLIAGENIYQPQDALPFKYSPTFAYFFRYSFFLLPEKMAAALWMLLSVFSFFGALAYASSTLLPFVKNPRRYCYFLIVAIILAWKGVLETLSFGQIDLFILAAYLVIGGSAWSPHHAKSGHRALRICLWVAILTAKPHFLFVWGITLFISPIVEAMMLAVAVLASYALPILWLGPASLNLQFRQWWNCLVEQQDASFMITNFNQSLSATMGRLAERADLVKHLGLGLLAAFGLFLLWLFSRLPRRALIAGIASQRARLLWWGFGLSSFLVFSPLSWRWLIAGWPPLVAIAAGETRLRYLAPWMLFTLFTQSALVGPLGFLKIDGPSYYGLFCFGSLALWAIFAGLLAQKRPT